MVLNMVKIGQAHVVAKLGLQHVVAVARHRQLYPLKLMGREREDVFLVIDDVERDAQVVGQRLATPQLADGTQYRERDVAVEPRKGANLAQGALAAVAVAEEGVGITLQAQALQGQMEFLKGYQVDKDASVIECPVICPLVQEGAGKRASACGKKRY